MIILLFFVIVAFILYLNSGNFFDSQELLENATYIVGLSAVLCFIFLYIGDFEEKINSYFLALLPLYLITIYLIKQKTKAKVLDIKANQQRYFNEAKAKDIVNFYSVRKDTKSNRVETLVNKENKKLMKNGYIVPQFFLDYKSLELTSISSLEELNQNAIFKAVFNKIKGFIKDLELRIDYDKILKENDHKAEFFLMSLWELCTKKFNISLANLDILAVNEKDKEFIGALDLLNLNCVKRKGAVLFYKYMEFKDRIKDYVKQEQLEINPKEEVFDEAYAKENDSDRTPYKSKEG